MEIKTNETKEANILGRRNEGLFTKGGRVREPHLHAHNSENALSLNLGYHYVGGNGIRGRTGGVVQKSVDILFKKG